MVGVCVVVPVGVLVNVALAPGLDVSVTVGNEGVKVDDGAAVQDGVNVATGTQVKDGAGVACAGARTSKRAPVQ